MKKILSFLILLGLAMVPAGQALAQWGGSNTLPTILGNIVTSLQLAFGALAVISLIYAAILFLISSGEPEKMNKGKRAVIYAIVGIVIAVVAPVVENIIRQVTGI